MKLEAVQKNSIKAFHQRPGSQLPVQVFTTKSDYKHAQRTVYYDPDLTL